VALNILGLERVAVSVLAGGGVTAVVLGFAFREIGENFLAGIFLAFSSPFKTGDLIRTEDIEAALICAIPICAPRTAKTFSCRVPSFLIDR
jgi:small-conductance mechanosensitive channel